MVEKNLEDIWRLVNESFAISSGSLIETSNNLGGNWLDTSRVRGQILDSVACLRRQEHEAEDVLPTLLANIELSVTMGIIGRSRADNIQNLLEETYGT